MRSIDNLREYALTAASVNATTRAVLAGYIDEIEREVEELRDRDYRNGREDAEGAVEFADRLKAAVDKREDVTLWGVDYTPLPVDADGVPIHVGDVMDEGKVAKVVLTDEHWEPSVYVYKLPNVQHEYFCSEVTHHHAPTVEDVLDEFANRLYEKSAYFDEEHVQKAIAEYAEKLRLAGEDA